VQPPSTLSAAPGHHRFVWPLRYPAPAPLANGNAWADGLWAPPGSYTVVLEVDGARLTQPLTVAADPRVTLPAEGYAQQLALARRIEDSRVRLAAATKEVATLTEALADRRKGASAEIGAALDALEAKVRELSGAAPPGQWWVPPRTIASLRFVGGALDDLATAVDGADVAPSPDALAGFEKAQATLAGTLAAWDELKAKDLAVLNARLKQAGQPVIALAP
jgi:hypothetical protein